MERREPMEIAASKLAKTPAAFAAQAQRFLQSPLQWQVLEGVTIAGNAWAPTTPNVVVDGEMTVEGTLNVDAEGHDGGTLIVLGDVRCRNFVIQPGFTFMCTGTLVAKEAIIATAADSITCVAGLVTSRFLDSGSGAWLTIYAPDSLTVEHISGYVMAGGRPLRIRPQADLEALLVPGVIEREEWESLDPEEREVESPADYLRVDDFAARRLLATGGSILR